MFLIGAAGRSGERSAGVSGRAGSSALDKLRVFIIARSTAFQRSGTFASNGPAENQGPRNRCVAGRPSILLDRNSPAAIFTVSSMRSEEHTSELQSPLKI